MIGVYSALGLALAALWVPWVRAQQDVVLDRVVAVVNNRPILESDLRAEMRLAVLEPQEAPDHKPDTPQEALQRLISRTLIRQQIRQEDAQTATPTAEEVAARLAELRKDLPVCVREHCDSEEGWKAFLASHDLTARQVDVYLRDRLEVLRFIETRFRQGVQISREQVQTYYRDTLLPQYLPGQATPALEQVAPRIEEILLQQQVNALFTGWLDNLRKQGDVEVLDPALEAAAPSGGGAP
ncbi:MAG TPA: peptidylprolyl isomerase [Terracidiphilus sp.]|nr:peptidylprolyl isomerase [Terracidiphilus sp.]